MTGLIVTVLGNCDDLLLKYIKYLYLRLHFHHY